MTALKAHHQATPITTALNLTVDSPARVKSLPTGRPNGFEGFIGGSSSMQTLYRTLIQVAHSDAPIFITGESGSGKELCATAIHRHSPVREGPFIAVNCAAIPAELLESQLFGHVRGAFTGAVSAQQGLAVAADGGTLFLDEIAELPLPLQSKLLRFLQTGQVMPVGATRTVEVNCRIVCATHQDPRQLVETHRFREDLFYRLHVIPLKVPPLRERGSDILEIANGLLSRMASHEGKHFTSLSACAEQALLAHDWPGNVRELENTLRRAIILHEGESLTAAMLDLPAHGGSHERLEHAPPGAENQGLWQRPLWMVERDAIETVIAACDGSIPRAAAILEIAPSTIYRKRLSWQAHHPGSSAAH
ncbi:sigma-54-dependent Fis family transcriptional regulator [Cobetia marina]|nr:MULTISPECIES: sigma-54 dependent transcriptional regulator [Cobetia]MDA5565457.1 sigma-54 dependent transcriptional regulator [Cobetia sp. MMG027]MDH2291914.1 sigma-54 dependent transcriptional regulator [Cobetia sp. 10Alg 146]MDH2373481.1 sigma-54 dependent transcriptional regulator [Cobetia sp. 3AK]MDI6003059.1 sigma-54 dependent transcriptional regulator [Cobetia pacifica]MDN2655499.1 sigma-54 dependent transcriptional regulator [Cobetia sp. 14N.309.X.WAT.E.A4]